ncbi:hypothetical protein CHUAL_006420 [Chamberlinius hualienensis]
MPSKRPSPWTVTHFFTLWKKESATGSSARTNVSVKDTEEGLNVDDDALDNCLTPLKPKQQEEESLDTFFVQQRNRESTQLTHCYSVQLTNGDEIVGNNSPKNTNVTSTKKPYKKAYSLTSLAFRNSRNRLFKDSIGGFEGDEMTGMSTGSGLFKQEMASALGEVCHITQNPFWILKHDYQSFDKTSTFEINVAKIFRVTPMAININFAIPSPISNSFVYKLITKS